MRASTVSDYLDAAKKSMKSNELLPVKTDKVTFRDSFEKDSLGPTTNIPSTLIQKPFMLETRKQAKPELLAPAGDWSALRAAVINGCNAVYFGLPAFNARYRATNFSVEELPSIIDYLHRHGVRGFVTLNTLIFEEEIEKILEYLEQIYTAGTDAVIVQDIGLAYLLQEYFPDLEVHASTQMSLSDALGVETVHQKLSIKRAVLARELTINQIGEIIQNISIPVEVFVHGALCVAYSGQCLTSEAIGGRSANRGQCAQACRLPYDLIVDGKKQVLDDRHYLLSPSDLAGYELIPELIRKGVSSFKIEGRLKDEYYVAQTVQVYRQGIDAALASEKNDCSSITSADSGNRFTPSPRTVRDLNQVFSRGFTTGFLQEINHQKLVQGRFPKSRGLFLGKVQSKTRQSIIIELNITRPELEAEIQNETGKSGLKSGQPKEEPKSDKAHASWIEHHIIQKIVRPGDGLVFDLGKPESQEPGGRITSLRLGSSALDQRLLIELFFENRDWNPEDIPLHSLVWKTDDPQLKERLRRDTAKDRVAQPILLNMTIQGELGKEVLLSGVDEDGFFSSASWAGPLLTAKKNPVQDDYLWQQLSRLGDSPFQLVKIINQLPDQSFLPAKILNQLRRELVDQLMSKRFPSRTINQNGFIAHDLRDNSISDAEQSPNGSGNHDSITESPEPFKGNTLRGNTLRDNTLKGNTLRVMNKNNSINFSAVIPESFSTNSLLPWEEKKSCLIVLVRNLNQLEAVLSWSTRTDAKEDPIRSAKNKVDLIYCDFEDTRKYTTAVQLARGSGCKIGLATVRISKPGEEGILRFLGNLQPDAILVRNISSMIFLREHYPGIPLVGDFSLNIANSWSAQWFLEQKLQWLTPSYDLNWNQLQKLIEVTHSRWFEIVIHQHMPMFHMEHCVFAAYLSQGKDYRDCGRPCEHHQIELKDRMGAAFPVVPDVGCRNTVYHADAQSALEYIDAMRALGIRRYRIELLREQKEEIDRFLDEYQKVIIGQIDGKSRWRILKQNHSLQLVNQLGLIRGTLRNDH